MNEVQVNHEELTRDELKSLLAKNRDETRASGERVIVKVNAMAEKYAANQEIGPEITALRGIGESLREFGNGSAPAMSSEIAANPDAKLLGEAKTEKAEDEKSEALSEQVEAEDKTQKVQSAAGDTVKDQPAKAKPKTVAKASKK